MNGVKYKITVSMDEFDIDKLKSELAKIDSVTIDEIQQEGFNGVDTITLLISSGALASIIASVSKVVIEFLKSKSERNITIGDVSLTGYSIKEAEKIIKNYEGELKKQIKNKK